MNRLRLVLVKRLLRAKLCWFVHSNSIIYQTERIQRDGVGHRKCVLGSAQMAVQHTGYSVNTVLHTVASDTLTPCEPPAMRFCKFVSVPFTRINLSMKGIYLIDGQPLYYKCYKACSICTWVYNCTRGYRK